MAKKVGRFVIELFADFLPDATPLFEPGFHRFGFDHFFHYGQTFRQPGTRNVSDSGRSVLPLPDSRRQRTFCEPDRAINPDGHVWLWSASSWGDLQQIRFVAHLL